MFFWCSSGVLLVFDNTEEHQKNPEEPRRTPEEKPPPAAGEWEGEEHPSPPFLGKFLANVFSTAAVRPGERMDMGQVTWEMRYTYSKGSTLHAFLETSQ